MKKSLISKIGCHSLILLASHTLTVCNAQTKKLNANADALESGFTIPPDSVKPSVYWYWINGNISKEGVVKDLEAMKKVGIGRAFIGNIGLEPSEMPNGPVKFFSDEWWDISKTAIKAASKNNIEIGMFNGPGWSQSGGPWIAPSQSMRFLSQKEIRVKGPQQFNQKLNVPENFQQVAVLAYPVPANEGDNISTYHPEISSNVVFDNIGLIADGNDSTKAFVTTKPDKKSSIEITFQTANDVTARSLTIHPADKPFKCMAELQVKEGGNFRTIKKFEVDRSNPANNVGFIPFAPVAVSFEAVKGSAFKLVLTEISGDVGFAEINLSGAAKVERYEEKQLAKMFQTPLPLWNEYQWPKQTEPDNKSLMVDPSKVINITDKLAADGTLNWSVPQGEWIIASFGMLPTGVTNAPAPPEGRGLEIDKLSSDYTKHHFDAFVGKVQNSLTKEEGKSLKWVVADSYETGSQNWTDKMTTLFKKQYGYDPLPWLPVLSGRVVASQDQSDRFLWDLRRLVADLVAYEYVGGLRKVSNANGMKIWLENYGHWGFPSEFLKYGGQADEIAGEFWNEGTLGNIECRAASSSAHIYGKTKVSAESFTAAGLSFQRYPAMLKRRGDWSFTEGINNALFHVFISQPYEDKNPGVATWFGTEFNRKNSWFLQGKAFIDYERRCSFLLQQGRPVNDIAYFIGEDAPKMTGTRDPELPAGYSYDYINAEVLMTRASVKDGKIVLPDGMSYRLLVLPQLKTMRPELLNKIKSLVADGATILGPAPEYSPSMQNYPLADAEVKKVAAELWGNASAGAQVKKAYGKGLVLNGFTAQQALDALNLIPDVAIDNTHALYAHRRTANADIYFITNQSDTVINLSPAFRVADKQPEWWDAVSGQTRDLPDFMQTQQSTTVPLRLEAYQSGFIVFRKPVTKVADDIENFPAPLRVSPVAGSWTVQFDTAAGGPLQPVVFSTLTDWSKSNDEKIKNYSGTAVYSTDVTIDKIAAGEHVYLDLGLVKAMAAVKVNGVSVGSAWTPPYKVDITSAIKKGNNKLEVEVVNTWVNRLIGDSKLPASERKTWTNITSYNADSKYESSGLLGPVKIEVIKY
ncbi:glycosyl hydrolase [Danxiaibacter flavus]|uniref:Glycosyl hydrolase n=1 Tax=Danxiaibacter flavus TaxID=3049108 RepID=A0ABV3ZII5_9BACT|nr:glycosyl hydrolase [Chitinophagaceae bacterium DXS]